MICVAGSEAVKYMQCTCDLCMYIHAHMPSLLTRNHKNRFHYFLKRG